MKKYILSIGFIVISILTIAQNNKLIAEKAGKGAVIIHEVQPKEGLYTLSRIYGLKVADIAAANGISKDKGLSIGQKIKIPLTNENLSQKKGKTPVYYTISDGETLIGISNRFNKVPLKDLKSWNKIDNDIAPKGKDIIVGYFSGTITTANVNTKQNSEPVKTAKNSTQQGIITGTNINIRKGPSTDQAVIGTAQQDEEVTILKKINNEWTSIRTKDGVEGYIASQFLQQSVKKAAPIKTGKIYGTNINIRKGPATDQEVIALAQQDDIVEILKEVNKEWVAIRTKDGVEGFMAAQFLNAKEAQPQPKKAETKVIAYGTNINIRKGPATDQEIVGMAKADEELFYLRKVDKDWSEIRQQDGVTGFVATRFLSFDGKPSDAALEAERLAKVQAEEAAAQERAIAAQKKDEEEKATALVSEKITAKNDAALTTVQAGTSIDEAGFFKSDFEKYKNPNLISEHLLSSGIFKTDRGWDDGKYYLLMDNAAPGTLVKLTNPDNNKSVYAKVLGKMKGVQYSEGYDIRISEAAAKKLQTENLNKFNVMLTY